MLKINTKAPNFILPSTSRDEFSIKDSIGKFVIIYFYPKDDTPGCTIETNDFNKNNRLISITDIFLINFFIKTSLC